MNVIILDDEIIIHKILTVLLENEKNIKVLKSFYNGEFALKFIQENEVDLIFCDMDMPKFSGSEFMKKFQSFKVKTKVVIMSSNKENAVKVINDRNLLYFIDKPLDSSKVKKAIEEYQHCQLKKDSNVIPSQGESYFFKSNKRIINIKYRDIYGITSEGNNAKVITKKETITVNSTLTELIKTLPNKYFRRVHKSHIVNILNIEVIFDRTIVMDNYHVPIGRSYLDDLKKYIL